MSLLNFNIIKLTLCLILGIIIGYYFNIPLKFSIFYCCVLLTALTVSFFVAKKQFNKTIWFGVFSFILMVLIGVLTTNFHNQKNFSDHYSHDILDSKKITKTITFSIREVLKPELYYNKYIINLLSIEDKPVSGKLLLNIEKNTLVSPLKVDAIYSTKTNFIELNQPLNPHQFNYKNYLEKKYIYHQLFTNHQALFKVKTKDFTCFGFANNIREYINQKLVAYQFKPNELAIINALLLGQRQAISKDIYSSYTKAGAIHILAVSGLHVGIILLFLNFIFKPLAHFKYGKLFKTIIIISFLWCFALIAGLSASVTRAVTMFSILAIGMHLKRPTNIYNTLAISMFIILLFKPLFLFDVGFQLSYLAVFSIVAIDPHLYKLWHPKNKILRLYWHTLTVTLSAQFGILPLSLFYFHQFPGLFFLSNLIIIPFLGILLGLGILVILLAVLNLLPQYLVHIYGYIIEFMNNFIGWIALQERFLFKDIPFSLLYVFTSYMLIICSFRFLIKRHYHSLKLFLISILIFQSGFLLTKISQAKNTFVIFHKSQHSMIGNSVSNKLILAHDFDSLTALNNKILKDYVVGNHLKVVEETKMKPIYLLGEKTLLIIDSLGTYQVKRFKPDYVLLTQSPKININRLIDSLRPKYIIADGSNYKTYLKHWKATCRKRKVPFHQTGKQGAFSINY